jgi:hypothetical protein
MTVENNAAVTETAESMAFSMRYKDAYLVARTVVGFSTLVKVVGVILAIVIFVVGLSIGRNGELFLPGLLLALVVGFMFFMFGVLIAAQGQMLQASLDTSVNSCPFLTNEQRTRIMSISAPSAVAMGSTACPKCGSTDSQLNSDMTSRQCYTCGTSFAGSTVLVNR